jgi:hypothetical protein
VGINLQGVLIGDLLDAGNLSSVSARILGSFQQPQLTRPMALGGVEGAAEADMAKAKRAVIVSVESCILDVVFTGSVEWIRENAQRNECKKSWN